MLDYSDDPDDGVLLIEIGPPEPPEDEFVVSEDGSIMGLEAVSLVTEVEFGANLAEHIAESKLTALASELLEKFRQDKDSRIKWIESTERGIELLGLVPVAKNQPWENACAVYHPILAEALVRFTSEAVMEMYPTSGPASVRLFGSEDTAAVKRGKRVKDELNYQLTVKMPEHRVNFEMILWRAGLMGSCFEKIRHDRHLKRPTSMLITAEDLVVSYGETTLHTCPRYSHVMRPLINEVRKDQHSGMYRKYPLITSAPEPNDIRDATDEVAGQERSFMMDEEQRELIEMYVDLDLEDFPDIGVDGEPTGIAVPYVVTIDRGANTIASIYRNHPEDNPYTRNPPCIMHYKYMPGFGFYGIGLAQLLGGIADSATSILRQLTDAGTISNVRAGFKAKGMRITGENRPLAPGEWRDVDVAGGKISDNLMPLQVNEPSGVLAQLLQALIDEGRRLASVADTKIADLNQASPVGTVMALMERIMRVMSAVQARMYVTQGESLSYIATIIGSEMGANYDYPVDGPFSRIADFQATKSHIIPVADPTASTVTQRLLRYRATAETAQQAPEVYDKARLHRDMIDALGLPNADKIVPLKDEMVQTDPIAENMNIMMMRPVRAFVGQDHEAHLRVHLAALNDPLIAQQIGQAPNAAAVQAAMAAHIQEHMAFAYRRRMEEAMGITLPDPEGQLNPDTEVELSRLAADAADRVLGRSQAEAQAMAQQQEQANPAMQLEREKLQVDRESDQIRREIAQLQADTALAQARIEQQRDELKAAVERERLKLQAGIEGANIGAKAEMEDKKIQSKERIAAAQIGERISASERKGNDGSGASKKPRRRAKKDDGGQDS